MIDTHALCQFNWANCALYHGKAAHIVLDACDVLAFAMQREDDGRSS